MGSLVAGMSLACLSPCHSSQKVELGQISIEMSDRRDPYTWGLYRDQSEGELLVPDMDCREILAFRPCLVQHQEETQQEIHEEDHSYQAYQEYLVLEMKRAG